MFEYMDWLKGKTSLSEDAPLLDQLKAYKTEVLEPEFASYERQIMVDKIQSGIRYENGSFTITIPEDAIPGTFNVTVSGMFQDISDGANWVPGETYAAPLDPAADSIEAANTKTNVKDITIVIFFFIKISPFLIYFDTSLSAKELSCSSWAYIYYTHFYRFEKG